MYYIVHLSNVFLARVNFMMHSLMNYDFVCEMRMNVMVRGVSMYYVVIPSMAVHTYPATEDMYTLYALYGLQYIPDYSVFPCSVSSPMFLHPIICYASIRALKSFIYVYLGE